VSSKPGAGHTLAAIVEAPDFLSGIDPATKNSAVEKLLEAKHPNALAAFRERQEAALLLETAVTAAKMSISDAAGIEGNQFETWFDNAEPQVSIVSSAA
jgi:hypothetical protein